MIVEMVRRRDSQNGYGQGAPYLAARTAKTAALETRADQSGQQLPRTCYSPLFRSSWQPGNRSTGRLQPPVGAHHHSPLQRGRAGRNRVVALLPRSPWAATVHCRSRRADRRGRPLAAAETHRHDAMVAGQTAGIPGSQKIIAEIAWNGSAVCCGVARSVGGTRRPGKSRTTRSFGPNTAACGGSTASGPSAGGDCAWTNLAR